MNLLQSPPVLSKTGISSVFFFSMLTSLSKSLLAILGGMCFYELMNLTVEYSSSSILAVTTKRYPF
jgi:hypothetical protein